MSLERDGTKGSGRLSCQLPGQEPPAQEAKTFPAGAGGDRPNSRVVTIAGTRPRSKPSSQAEIKGSVKKLLLFLDRYMAIIEFSGLYNPFG